MELVSLDFNFFAREGSVQILSVVRGHRREGSPLVDVVENLVGENRQLGRVRFWRQSFDFCQEENLLRPVSGMAESSVQPDKVKQLSVVSSSRNCSRLVVNAARRI